MKISRYFTQSGSDPYATIPFEPRKSEIRNPDGSTVFLMENVMVPAHWSQVATDILAQKYFRKAGLTVGKLNGAEYAGDNAAFSMPFVNLGLCPEAGSSILVPQMMGHHRAAEALLMGEPFMAEAAQEVGLINRVVPPTEVNSYAQAQARKLAAKPLSSLVETKRLMKSGQSAQIMAQIETEAASFGRMLQEPAAREAFGAFMEKRRPDFSNL